MIPILIGCSVNSISSEGRPCALGSKDTCGSGTYCDPISERCRRALDGAISNDDFDVRHDGGSDVGQDIPSSLQDALSDIALDGVVPDAGVDAPRDLGQDVLIDMPIPDVFIPIDQPIADQPSSDSPPPILLQLAPIADTHVKAEFPTSNYGNENNLRLRATDYYIFLKFQVSGLSGPAKEAKLRLFVIDISPQGGSVFSVSNNYGNWQTPWTELGIYWNNAPAVTGSPIGSFSPPKLNTWVEADITSAIQGNGTYSFAIATGSIDSVIYNSKEAPTNRPVLVIK